MLIRRFRPNKKDPVEIVYGNGVKLLMSYEAAVAAFIPGQGYLITDLNLTPTSRDRIDIWIKQFPHAAVEYVPQDDIYKIFTSRPIWTVENREAMEAAAED